MIRNTGSNSAEKLPEPFRGIRVVPMQESHGPLLCAWRYKKPYDIFNWPSWEEMTARAIEFGDPELRAKQFASVVNGDGELLGFAQFFPITGVTRLGVGMRSDLCGLGAGPAFMRAIAEEARRRMPGNIIDLEVLTWNKRAIKAYSKAGFVVEDTYWRPTPIGPDEFHCMVYRAGGPDAGTS